MQVAMCTAFNDKCDSCLYACQGQGVDTLKHTASPESRHQSLSAEVCSRNYLS